MTILVSGLLVLLAFLVHVAWWRVKKPKAPNRAVVLVFFGCLVLGTGMLVIAERTCPALQGYLPAGLVQWTQVLVLSFALAAAYIGTYPAIEVDSPTVLIVDLLDRAGPNGLSLDEIYSTLNDDVLTLPRIADLLTENLAAEIDGKLVLTHQGRSLAALFMGWQAMLRSGKGG